MSLNMKVNVNLLKLKGVEEIRRDGKQGIFIPYRENVIYRGRDSAFIQFYMLQKLDRFNNPYMVARSLTKEERDRNAPLTFLGNANYDQNNKPKREKQPKKQQAKKRDLNNYKKYTDEDDFV